MALTRKDFVALAKILNDGLISTTDRDAAINVRNMIRDIASYCAISNGGFNQPLFFTACGLTADGQLPADDEDVLIETLEGLIR